MAFQFAVEIDGLQAGWFTECSGLDMKTDVYEYKEGGLNGYTHKLPGRTSFSNLTLKRGMVDTSTLYDWYVRLISKADKSAELRRVSVVQMSLTHEEIHRWNLEKAFPVKWVGPSFHADQSAQSVESFELAFEQLALVRR
ncbi:MAG: phage tail protein [Chloroflexi bacterium]|nr:phage tail protein [Chloroflexota bacterium]